MMKIRLITVLSLSALLMAGCSSDDTDLQEFIEKTRSMHLGSVEPLPQFKPYKNFVYSAGNMRDPFEPAFEENAEKEKQGPSPDNQRPREPLEKFPLDTLRMVGILEQKNQLWGLIKDPQNIVHRVQVGNYAGQNEGQIVSVSEDKIELVEIVPDSLGGFVERHATLSISEK